MQKERTVESVDLDGNKVKLVVKSPTPKVYRDSQIAYNKALRSALESGAMLRDKLQSYYQEQNIWNDAKEQQYQDVLKAIQELEKRLKKGGIALKEAKRVALDLKTKRAEFTSLISERQSFDVNSAESQAENARFNFLVSACVCGTDGQQKWKSVDAYDEDALQPWANAAAQELANMLYGLDTSYEEKLVENQFLLKYKFVDKTFNLLNDKGHPVDAEGRLINSEGRFVAYRDSGEQYFVDVNGNEVDELGQPVLEFSPFLDDDGNPVVDEEVVVDNTEVPDVVDESN